MLSFTGSRLDRADHVRADPERLAGCMNWKARVLTLDGLMPSLDDANRLVWGTLADVPEDAELCFLGLDEGKACFAAVPPRGDATPRMANPQLWSLMSTLQPDDLAIYGGARSLADWHARHRFCAQCGGDTKLAKGGWQRNCTACEASHFPRTDPVTIMLITHGNDVLMGRSPGWPGGMYSLLAGFVEPGEPIEAAVRRDGGAHTDGYAYGDSTNDAFVLLCERPCSGGGGANFLVDAAATAASDPLAS